jgi:hypothetical protein
MTRRRGELSCCGYFIRILLGLVNLLILLIGIGLVTVASLFKWSTVFDFVKKYDGLDAFVSVTTLDSIVIALLVIGAFLIVVSLVGFIACVTMNRFFLGVYEVLLVMIFLAHLGALIALLVLRPKFEETLKTEFNNVVLKINNASSYGISNDQLENAYTALNAISKTFTCCGKLFINGYLLRVIINRFFLFLFRNQQS